MLSYHVLVIFAGHLFASTKYFGWFYIPLKTIASKKFHPLQYFLNCLPLNVRFKLFIKWIYTCNINLHNSEIGKDNFQSVVKYTVVKIFLLDLNLWVLGRNRT